jgi:hypothetical protein
MPKMDRAPLGETVLVSKQLEPFRDSQPDLHGVDLEGAATDHGGAVSGIVAYVQEPNLGEGTGVLGLDRVAQRSGEAVEGMVALEESAGRLGH